MPSNQDRNKGLSKKVLERDNYICQCCGLKASEAHHIVPLGREGKDEMDNIVALCGMCHKGCHKRGVYSKEEFQKYKETGGFSWVYFLGLFANNCLIYGVDFNENMWICIKSWKLFKAIDKGDYWHKPIKEFILNECLK